MKRQLGGGTRPVGTTPAPRWRDRRRPGTGAGRIPALALALVLACGLFAIDIDGRAASQEAPQEARQDAPKESSKAATEQAPDPGRSVLTRYDLPYQAFAVHIFRKPRQSWPGFGIYLGDGLVLTAAHVVGHPTQGDPSVEIAGQTLEAKIVREGEFELVDLTLLRIDSSQLPPSLALRLMPLCAAAPRVGQPVVVATPEALSTSHILSPKALPPEFHSTRFDTLIADVATTGNSGSGVFDPAKNCLMGIMSRKLQIAAGGAQEPGGKPKMLDLAKYFVPAREIGPFIGSR
ncbi:serine protease [uncultured Rhodoblastus sp.]|uniref:S1 family peptidase n=1 Tax=uncultured Rhodoblastus sp. TaxID=543037 RepID=UPI0025D1D42A|nr:serine protease [uncultured Rhodoblastus sp.]